MSRTSGRVSVAAASTVALSALIAFVVSSLLPGTLVADLWHEVRKPAWVQSWPDAPPAVRVVVAPIGPFAPPEPLPVLDVRWDNKVSVDMPTFREWAPSDAAQARLEGLVSVQLGTPNVVANGRCGEPDYRAGGERLCWSIVDTVYPVVDGRRVAMVTAVGSDAYDRLYPSRSVSARLALFALSPRGTDDWTIDTSRTDIETGQYGQPGSFRVGALGPATAGWIVDDAWNAMDDEGRRVSAFAVDGHSIRRVLDTDVRLVQPAPRQFCFGGEVDVTLRLDPQAENNGFYRLTGERVHRYWTDDEWTDDAGHIAVRVPVALRYRRETRSYPSLTIETASHPRTPVRNPQSFDCGVHVWAMDK